MPPKRPDVPKLVLGTSHLSTSETMEPASNDVSGPDVSLTTLVAPDDDDDNIPNDGWQVIEVDRVIAGPGTPGPPVFHDCLEGVIHSEAEPSQSPTAKPLRGRDGREFWKDLLDFVEHNNDMSLIVQYCSTHCTETYPTKFFRENKYLAPLKAVLESPEGQLWYLQNPSDTGIFRRMFIDWASKIGASVFLNSVERALSVCMSRTLSDGEALSIVNLLLECATEMNDMSESNPLARRVTTVLAACVTKNQSARALVYNFIERSSERSTTRIPNVVSFSILSPLVSYVYPLRGEPQTQMDKFLLQLAKIGFSHDAYLTQTWFKIATHIIATCVFEDSSVLKTKEVNAFQETVWKTLARAVDDGFVVSRNFWPEKAPVRFFSKPEDFSRCIPHERKVMLISFRAVANPGSLTLDETKLISPELVEIFRTRNVPTIAQGSVNAKDLFSQLQTHRENFAILNEFREAASPFLSKNLGKLQSVGMPSLSYDTPLNETRVEAHPLIEEMCSDQLNKRTLLKSLMETSTRERSKLERAFTAAASRYSSFWDCLADTQKFLLRSVDNATVEEVAKLSDDELCIQGIPHFLVWFNERPLLQELVSVVEANHDDQRAALKPDLVYSALKISLYLKTGGDYRVWNDQLQETLRSSRRRLRLSVKDITQDLLRNILKFCSPSSKSLRLLAERKFQGIRRKIVTAGDYRTKEWEDPEKKSILAAYAVLAEVIPSRINQASDAIDEYEFDDLLYGMVEALRRRQHFLDDLNEDAVQSIANLMNSFQQRYNPTVEATAKEVNQFGYFECRTVEDYETIDGVSRSYWIAMRAGRHRPTDEIQYNADKISSMLAGMNVSKAPGRDIEQLSMSLPTLRRLVEIGVNCLNCGFREFVPFIRKNFKSVGDALNMENREIHGRQTGFHFSIKLSNIDSAFCTKLSEMVRLVASECENFVGSIEQLRSPYPVLYCFNKTEIGLMLAAMLDPIERSTEALYQLIVRRLGEVKFVPQRLDGLQKEELMPRLKRLAEALGELCAVDLGSQLQPPTVLYLENSSEWPLAVANAMNVDGNRKISADQVCLPLGSKAEMINARENFLRRVMSGVCPQNASAVFCLVIPEPASESSDMLSILREVCRYSRSQFFVIVHKSYVSLERRTSLFGDFPIAQATVSFDAEGFFTPGRERILVVRGPSRSGKMKLSRDKAVEQLKVSQGRKAVACERFLSGSTLSHELSSLLSGVGKSNAAIIEIGSGLTDHLQALIFSLALGFWSARDGAASRRVHPVILKVHEDFFTELPVLWLMKTFPAGGTRPTSTLSVQFSSFVDSLSLRLSEPLRTIATSVGAKLDISTSLPLTAAAWAKATTPCYFPEFRALLEATELPEFLMTFPNGVPVLCCMNASVGYEVLKQKLEHDGKQIEYHILDQMSSDDLWKLAFTVLETPTSMRVIPGIVMTACILQSLIRLDLSVRCRRVKGVDICDDGVVSFVGETGSGKTQMIDTYSRYRGWGRPRVIHVDSGTTEADIVRQVSALLDERRSSKMPSPTVIFFDEFNTSPAQDTIKRVLLDRRLPRADGQHDVLPSTRDGWIFVAACNPYAILSSDSNTKRQVLKYTVQPHVSPSLVGSCWRLPLPTRREEACIVMSMCEKCGVPQQDCEYFSRAVPFLHRFLERRADMVPYSLRTVSRLLRLYRHLDRITCLDAICNDKPCKHSFSDPATPTSFDEAQPSFALAPLALAVNYFVALPQQKRSELESEDLEGVLLHNGTTLQWYLNDFGKKLGPMYQACAKKVGLALPNELHRLESLYETLAVTYVCVYTQTPLFLIGPPGSSKTLATFIVLWGQLRKDAVHLRRLEPLYFQCSKHTTAHSLEKAIRDAKTQAAQQVTFVHVLDEIGNADQALGHPLRVLNHHLERSVFDEDGNPENLDPDVHLGYQSFIGTSNYFLDRSLLGRAVILQRDNPSLNELQELFGADFDKALVTKMTSALVDVEVMQNQQNSILPSSIHNCKLTMRDMYALHSSTCNPSSHLRTEKAVIKAMSLRGNAMLKPPRSKERFKAIQEELLCERLDMIAKECGVNATVPPPGTPRLQRKATTTAALHEGTPELKVESTSDSDPLTHYQARERPLMLSADHLSTVFAALDNHGLREATTVIYGKYLVSDEQMITSTMLQLREAMKTKNKVCLFVDCESLIESMLDVLNGFYQRDDEDEEFMVRVVLDGRSDDWPIAPGFNMRCIFVIVDETTFASFDSGPKSFTPAIESRFEKIFVTADMFENKPKSRLLTSLRDDFQLKYLGYTSQNSIDAAVLPEIIGYHPLMLACSEDQHHSIELLGRSDVIMMHTQLPNDIAFDNVVALDKQQSLAECVSRHVADANHLYSLILCPVGHIREGSGLESLAQAQAVAAQAMKGMKGDVRSLAVRSGTLDMLFEIAVRNLLATATSAVIAISHSQINPLEESHILAVCNFVATVAEERNAKCRIILFAPVSQITTKVTIPFKWRTSYCDAPIPFTVPAVESRCYAMMPLLRCIEINTAVRYDIFPKGTSKLSFWEKFEKSVRKSTSAKAVQHLLVQIKKNISVSQAIAEMVAYQDFICKVRWWLSFHWSNHKYFARQFGGRVGWETIRDDLLLRDEILPEYFLLSPSREGGLPAAQTVTSGTLSLECIVQCDLIEAHLKQHCDRKGNERKALEIQHCMTHARLSGAQSNAELLALWQLSQAASETSPNGSPLSAEPRESLFRLPLTSQQMSSLRTFEAITPSTAASEGLSFDFDLTKVHALLCAESDMTRAVALAQLCKALRDRRHTVTLRRVKAGQLSGGIEQPSKDDLFVRIAVTYGLNLAIHIFCNPPDSINAFEATMSNYNQFVAAQTTHDLKMALNRSFQWDPNLNNDELRSNRLFNEISSIRSELESEPRLSDIGHYVYLYRALKEQLFTVDPLSPSAGKPDEQLVGVVTYEMINALCIEGLPKSLQNYLQRLLGRECCREDNVLDVFENLRSTLDRLMNFNNDILKRCHALLKNGNGTELRRIMVAWPLVTVHHQMISSALFNEVWKTNDVTRERLRHFEEVIGGLPEISLLEHFPSRRVAAAASFQREPNASEVFSQ